MRISIAMATYNGARHLNEQLNSFIDQTRQPDELVISDDGSTDDTVEIIEEFARYSPFDVYFSRNKENLGYSGNFNAALLRTTGDLVFLSDQDDVWFPEKIAYLESLAVGNADKLLFMNDAVLTDGDLNEVGLTKLGQIRSAGLKDTEFVMGCCCAIRRELLNICMPIPTTYRSHDDWIVKFGDGLRSKVISEDAMQYYRRHGGNESDFIANRTSRVTRWTIVKQNSRFLDRNKKSKQVSEQVDQLIQLSKGVERALQRTHAYSDRLESMLVKQMNLVEMIEGRTIIRKKSAPIRFVAALCYWMKGYYSHASGWKSMLRDFLG